MLDVSNLPCARCARRGGLCDYHYLCAVRVLAGLDALDARARGVRDAAEGAAGFRARRVCRRCRAPLNVESGQSYCGARCRRLAARGRADQHVAEARRS